MLSPKTVGYHLGVAKMIFAKAIAWKYVYSNPTEGIKRPRCEEKEIEVLTEAQVDLVLENADEQTKMMVLTAYQAGLRAGEIAGLRWGDVKLLQSIVQVRQNFTHGRMGTPKSRGSKRDVIVPASLIDALASYKPDNAEDADLVFSDNGEPIPWSRFLHGRWEPLLKRQELPLVKFHSLRHLYGSLLLAYGEPIAFVSKQLGHSNVAITLKVYTHSLESSEAGAGERLTRIFGGSIRRILEDRPSEKNLESAELSITPVSS